MAGQAVAVVAVAADTEADSVVAVAGTEGGREVEVGSAVAGSSAGIASVLAAAAVAGADYHPIYGLPELDGTAVQAVVEVEGIGDMAVVVGWKREEDREAAEENTALLELGYADSGSSTL